MIHKPSLRVVTSNFQAASTFSQSPHIEVWLAGGRLRANDQDLVGYSALEFMAKFSVDIGFISCASVKEVEEGQLFVLEFMPEERGLSQCILCNSTQKWLLISKSGPRMIVSK